MDQEKITYQALRNNKTVGALIQAGDEQLGTLGFTEHSFRHVGTAAHRAGEILSTLGYEERTCELAKIAALLHDIGNGINRNDHAHSGAIMVWKILGDIGMDIEEITTIMGAIGNHDERTGTAVSAVSAALILADKSDVHRSRVRNTDFATFDIHDRVNYAVQYTEIMVRPEEKKIILNLKIDTEICSVMEYFEIFLDRMTMCRKAADYLGCQFKLIINDSTLL